MNRTYIPEFLTPDDVIEPLVTNVLRDYQITFDKWAFEAFSKYGYSKDWILDPANRYRIRIVNIIDDTIFKVDKQTLFKIKMRLEPKGDNSFAVVCDLKYIAPFSEDVNDG